MKTVKYKCDRCKKPIDGRNDSNWAGGGELCVLSYLGKMGQNKFPSDFHYHYYCFNFVVNAILQANFAPVWEDK